jgi:hypothetical protein
LSKFASGAGRILISATSVARIEAAEARASNECEGISEATMGELTAWTTKLREDELNPSEGRLSEEPQIECGLFCAEYEKLIYLTTKGSRL